MSINTKPPMKWAQRQDKVYLTIDMQDLANAQVTFDKQKVSFKADSKATKIEAEVELFEAIKPEESKWVTRGRGVEILMMKEKEEDSWWPRLTKDKKKFTNIQVDWSLWIDEDEEGKEPDFGDFGGMGGMPGMGDMGGMGGMPGMGGMGGAGGMGGMDLEALMKQYKASGGLDEEEAAIDKHVHSGGGCSCGEDGCKTDGHKHDDDSDDEMPALEK